MTAGIAPSDRPEIGDELRDGREGTEEHRVLVGPGSPAERAEQPHADADAGADRQRDQQLSADISGQGLLHPDDQAGSALRRREAPVGRLRQTPHVEEHVDGDDDHEDQAQNQPEDRDRRPADEVDRLGRVLLDVRVLEVRRDLVALLADIQALEPVVVQPELEIVDALLEPGLAGLSVLDRKVVLDPIRRRLRLVDHDEADGRKPPRSPPQRS